jgi:hypothetical protein
VAIYRRWLVGISQRASIEINGSELERVALERFDAKVCCPGLVLSYSTEVAIQVGNL